jgi:hypothetical protein
LLSFLCGLPMNIMTMGKTTTSSCIARCCSPMVI